MSHSAKKRFGQHFLRDAGVLNRIVKWIQPSSEDFFIEIGAGDGALSLRLAPAVAHLLAIELDIDCIPTLERTLARFENTTVIAGDILQLNLREIVQRHLKSGQNLQFAGNLPYNIATPIITRILRSNIPVENMFFMVQLEVARRIAAKPGSRQYGYLSVYCQHHSDVRIGFRVSPACFVPRPKVSSAMVSLRPKRSHFNLSFESDFDALCKAAFGHRRKTLANALAKHPIFRSTADTLLRISEINGGRRAEELSVGEYQHLAQTYVRFCKHLS